MQAKSINMAQALLERGRELWEQDRYEEACRVLTRLLGLRVLKPQIAERAQFYLGDMQVAQGFYSKARRHLSAAISTGTASGEAHFLMACALEWDDDSDLGHAYRHYRRAVELEPGQPLYSSAYALMRIRRKSKRTKFDREALARLRDSFAACPDDSDIVYNYAFGLIEMARFGEAEFALKRARKRWPDHPAFEGLWHDFLIRRGLLPGSRRAPADTPAPCVVSDEEPVIIPFPTNCPRVDRPARLSSAPSLRMVLATLPKVELTKLQHTLKLVPRSTARENRREIRRALLDRQRLQSLVMDLSVGSRHVIKILSAEGGRADVKRLHMRVDGPAKRRAHFSGSRSNKPLDELRQSGLVYLAGPDGEATKSETALIPADLGKMLGEVMISTRT